MVGPVATADLRALLDRREIDQQTLVARVGATSWTLFSETPELQHLFTADSASFQSYAGFWMRLLAYILDYFLLWVVLTVGLVVLFAAGWLTLSLMVEPEMVELLEKGLVVGGLGVPAYLFSIGGAIAYYVSFNRGPWQATPGKRICGIHIMRTSGERVTGSLAFGRYLAYFVSAILLGFGFLMIGWTNQKKGLHDIICNTRVVYGKLS